MSSAGSVTAARVTHETGTVADLAAASPESQEAAVEALLDVPGIEEAFVLSTCNRVEAYVVAPDPAVGQAALRELFAATENGLVVSGHDESLRHLLRVAAGLESVVLGEDQILGQVRDAYEDARTAGGIGDMLEAAVTKAMHVGERARTETAINEGVVSLGSAATRLAAEDVTLEGATGLVVGAGEMGQLAARSLADTSVEELVVANRTVSRAQHLADELEVEVDAVPLAALETVAPEADVVVTATGSSDPLLEPDHIAVEDGDARGDGPERVVVDLGQPRDVDPAADALDGIVVYDMDDLETVTERTREQRVDAAREVEAMIDCEFELLCEQYKRARADEVIAAMYESAERLKRRELETALSQLEDEEFTEEQREIVESMADALVNQLLAPPTKSLREAAAEDDWSTINTALQLFDPDFEEEKTPSSTGGPTNVERPIGATDDD